MQVTRPQRRLVQAGASQIDLDHTADREQRRRIAMTMRRVLFVAAAIAAALVMQSSANALTMTECSAKYKEAKAAGTLNGAWTWNAFRKSQCDLAPAKRAKSAAASDSTVVAANAVFPSAVDSKYSNEKPGRARRKTCLDQHKANKTTNANGGLRWLQRGDGRYSQCAKKLKGALRSLSDYALFGSLVRHARPCLCRASTS